MHYIWFDILGKWKLNLFNNSVGIGKNNPKSCKTTQEKYIILNKTSKASNTKDWHSGELQQMTNPKAYKR